MVASYIGSQGNPTSSLLNATFEAVEALAEEIDSLNNGLQFVIGKLAEIEAELLDSPINNLKTSIHSKLFAMWSSTTQLRRSELDAANKGMPIDPLARYEDIRRAYVDKWLDSRNEYLALGPDISFENALHVCLARQVEIDLITYLIGRASELKLKLPPIGQTDLVQAEQAYQEYFAKAQDSSNPKSMVNLIALAGKRLETVKSKMTFKEGNFGPYAVGCTFLGREPLHTQNRKWWYQTRYVNIVSQQVTEQLNHLEAGPISDSDKKFYFSGLVWGKQTTDGELPPSAACKFQNEAGYSPARRRFIIVSVTDPAQVKRLLGEIQDETERTKASQLSPAEWNVRIIDDELDHYFSAQSTYLGLIKALEAIQLSETASKCNVAIFDKGDAGCLRSN